MNPTSQLVVALSSVVVVSLLIGFSSRRYTKSLRSFFWGDNDLGADSGADLFLSTSFSMNGLLYQTFLGYAIGIASLWIQVIWCLSYLILWLKAKKVAELARTGTLHGVIGAHFGVRAEKAAAIATIVGFTVQVGWELAVGMSVFSASAPGNRPFLLVMTISLAVVAAGYTVLGGLRGNLLTNVVQNRLAGVSMLVAIVFLISTGRTLVTPVSTTQSSHVLLVSVLTWGGLITNIVFSLTWQLVDMSAWQNMAAARLDENIPRKTLLWSALWVFIFPGLVGTLLGMYLRSTPNLDPNSIMPALVSAISTHSELGFIFFAGLVAAMLSTVDGLLLAAGQAVTWDLTHKKAVTAILKAGNPLTAEAEGAHTAKAENPLAANGEKTRSEAVFPAPLRDQERKILRLSQLAILILALLGALGVAFVVGNGVNLFDVVYLATVAQMALVPVVVSILFFSSTKQAGNGFVSVTLGLLVGIPSAFAGIAYHQPQLLNWAPVFSLAAAALGLLFTNAIGNSSGSSE